MDIKTRISLTERAYRLAAADIAEAYPSLTVQAAANRYSVDPAVLAARLPARLRIAEKAPQEAA